MKKLILVSILALSLSIVSSAVAATALSVQYPSSFTLKVSDSATVTNYQDMKIELKGIQGISTMSYPSQTKNIAQIHVSTPGGCGPNADPRCLGAPAFTYDYTISAGSSVYALGLSIKAVTVSSDSAKFEIKLGEGTTDTDSSVSSGTTGTVTGGGTGTAGGSGGSVSGGITVCSNGASGDDCSVCSDGRCEPKPVEPGTPVPSRPGIDIMPMTVSLPKGEVLQSFEANETKEDGSVSSGSDQTYTLKTKKKVRLFFIIPMSAEFTYSVNSETGERTVTSRPWWKFLAW